MNLYQFGTCFERVNLEKAGLQSVFSLAKLLICRGWQKGQKDFFAIRAIFSHLQLFNQPSFCNS